MGNESAGSTHPDTGALQRVRRINLLAATAITATLLAWAVFGALAGFIKWPVVAMAALLSLTCCLIGLEMIRRGWNLRLRHPDLAEPFVIAATFVVLLMTHQLDPALRGSTTPWVIMAFAFGTFGTRTRAAMPMAMKVSVMLLIEAGWYGLAAGSWAWLLWQTSATVAAVSCLAVFSTQVNRQRSAANRQLQLDKTVLDSIADAVVTLDCTGRIVDLNRAAEELIGCDCRTAAGSRLIDRLRWAGADDARLIETLIAGEDLEGLARVQAHGLDERRRRQPLLDMECSSARVQDRSGQLFGQVLVMRDVSETAQLMRRLEHDSCHDELTGLRNRRGLQVALTQLATSATASHDAAPLPHALMIVDLDQFKIVNDTCGHAAGDELIRRVAQTLQAAVRQYDVVTRYGGDEFAILLRDADRDTAYRLGERMLAAVAGLHFEWGGRRFQTGASIGCALIDTPAFDADTLILRADSALYLAKDLGRGRMQMHAEGDEHIARKSRELEWACRINEALESDGFVLFAQRIVPAGAADNEYVELLIRMKGENGALIGPGEFLPAAERFSLMPAIDRWVLKWALRSLEQCRHDRHEGPRISINLSAQSIHDLTFLAHLTESIRASSVPADRLCFELTETVAVANFERARQFIDTVRALGCQFALDDVGSGFNSFSYLRHLTFDSIKIDGHYVRGLAHNAVDRTLIQSLIDLARTMGMGTVAEMVETDADADLLREMGILHLQGYALHRPEPLSDLLRMSAVPAATPDESSESIPLAAEPVES